MLSIETPAEAKQFLFSKLQQQAETEGLELSDVERRMFLFSEVCGDTDWEANDRFEVEYDANQYERKISKLLKNSFDKDKHDPDAKADWTRALAILRNEDFYGLVMVDQARIPRPKPSPVIVAREIGRGLLRLENPRFLVAKASIAILGLVLFLDPFHWRLVVSDLGKWFCVALAVVMIGLLSRLEKGASTRKSKEDVSMQSIGKDLDSSLRSE